jgi:hypothetical protein
MKKSSNVTLKSARLSNPLTAKIIHSVISSSETPFSSVDFIKFFLVYVSAILSAEFNGKTRKVTHANGKIDVYRPLLTEFNYKWKNSIIVDAKTYQSIEFDLYDAEFKPVTSLTDLERSELETLSKLSSPYSLTFEFTNKKLLMKIHK